MKSKRLSPIGQVLLTAILATSLMTAGFATEVRAADAEPTTTITMDGTANSYSAYRLMDLTTSLKTDVDHGAVDHVHDKNCWNYAYKVNADYRDIIVASLTDADVDGDGVVSDNEIVTTLSAMTDKGDEIRTFADAVYKQIKTNNHAAESTSSTKVFADVPQGYYLIAENERASASDATSLVMLDTAGQEDIKVNSKESVPTITSYVKEENDSTGSSKWSQMADMDGNDTVMYQMIGTMPSNIDGFEQYSYQFVSKMPVGLTVLPEKVTVTIGGTVLTPDSVTVENQILKVSFTDILKTAQEKGLTITKDTQITTEYQAAFNLDKITVGITDQNRTESYIVASADPYDATATLTTNHVTTSVVCYKLTINKKDTKDNALTGANFKLDKWVDGAYKDYDNGVNAYDANQSVFEFEGLDAGKYRLSEIKTPAGYNDIEPIEFEIVSTIEGESVSNLSVQDKDGDAMTDFSSNNGSISVNVINVSGIKLPSTGGSGVYIFYVGGALVILAAIVLVVSQNKKTKKNN